ncbi:sensor histidine kinase [Nocardiopsis composta]
MPLLPDLALAAGVAAIVAADTLLAALPSDLPPALRVLVVIAGPAALVLRKRAPRAVLAAEVVWTMVHLSTGGTGPIGALPALVAVYTAVDLGHWRFSAALVGPVLAVSLGTEIAAAEASAAAVLRENLLPVGWFVAAGVMGEAHRRRLAHTREVERRAAEAERTREEAALRRAGEERLRIARELHDSLTHSISVIKVQAGVAAHLARKRGEEVPGALLAIQEASGAAARELRSTLEVLRAPGGEDAPPAGGRVGLARLDELVGRARVSGLPVAVAVRGEPAGLPPAVDRAAFRIVQEALTNAVRHAGGGASASVLLEYRADGLGVLVEDDGRASPDALRSREPA